ncbi:MAG TPA: hypothetical protein VMX57_00980, partial [Planctomycetota bacterium]|nr:hypothetical protein [Planctomycetota bacterium]
MSDEGDDLWGSPGESPDEVYHLAKAHVVGRPDKESLFAVSADAAYKNIDANLAQKIVEPPFSPTAYLAIAQKSNMLRAPIDTYAKNIDAFGHSFVPVIDPSTPEGLEDIRTAILLERERAAETATLIQKSASGAAPSDVVRGLRKRRPPVKQEVTEKEVAARAKEVAREIRIQRFTAERFFEQAPVDKTFVRLRLESRVDLETGGNFYWEVARNRLGEIARLEQRRSHEMRLLSWDRADDIDVVRPTPISKLSSEDDEIRVRFRRYVQLKDGGTTPVYFKSLGDPRVISSATGKWYPSVEAMRHPEAGEVEGVRPATEILHYRIYDSQSDYGVARWIGNLLDVLGSSSACEVNFLYFKNKSVPPLALFVSGGTLSRDSKSRIESYIENNIKGEQNFHRILILEAVSGKNAAGNESAVRIELQPLTKAQLQDAQFLQYLSANKASLD